MGRIELREGACGEFLKPAQFAIRDAIVEARWTRDTGGERQPGGAALYLRSSSRSR
jgi:hypothetical protein